MAALQEKKSCSQRMEEFQRYCWNPDTGQMLGRTLSRWGTCPRGWGRQGWAARRTRTDQPPAVQAPRTQILPGLLARLHLPHQMTPKASNPHCQQTPTKWEHLRGSPKGSALDLRRAFFKLCSPKLGFLRTFKLRGTEHLLGDENILEHETSDGCKTLGPTGRPPLPCLSPQCGSASTMWVSMW